MRTKWKIDAQIDLVTEEDNFKKMMYKNISTNHKVIVVLSEGYAVKANKFKKSGVTTEYERIINDIDDHPKKYILVAFDNRNSEKIPLAFKGHDVIVLNEELKEENLTESQNRLLSKLTDDPIFEEPPLSGKTPKVTKKRF